MVVRYKSTGDILGSESFANVHDDHEDEGEDEESECKLKENSVTCRLLHQMKPDTCHRDCYDYDDKRRGEFNYWFPRTTKPSSGNKWHSCKFLRSNQETTKSIGSSTKEDEKLNSYYRGEGRDFLCKPSKICQHYEGYHETGGECINYNGKSKAGLQSKHCKSAIDFYSLIGGEQPEVEERNEIDFYNERTVKNLSGQRDVIIVRSPSILRALDGEPRRSSSSSSRSQLKQLKRHKRRRNFEQRVKKASPLLSSQLATSSPTLRVGSDGGGADEARRQDNDEAKNCGISGQQQQQREDCCVRTQSAGNDTVLLASGRHQQVAVIGDAYKVGELDEWQRRRHLTALRLEGGTKDSEGMAASLANYHSATRESAEEVAAADNLAGKVVELSELKERRRVGQLEHQLQWHTSEARKQLNPREEADTSRRVSGVGGSGGGSGHYFGAAAVVAQVANGQLQQVDLAASKQQQQQQQQVAVVSTEGQRQRANSMAAKDASFKFVSHQNTTATNTTATATKITTTTIETGEGVAPNGNQSQQLVTPASCALESQQKQRAEMAIVDLTNSVANQLVAGACSKLSSWSRQHSASYEVAQEQERLHQQLVEETGSNSNKRLQQQISSANSTSQHKQQQLQLQIQGQAREILALPTTEVSRPTEVAASVAVSTESRSRRNHVGHKSRQTNRPGRSPVSLQRETSARLARHRLKIQQQRQEQLASLALRERQQLGSVYQSSDIGGSSRPQVTPNHHRHSINSRQSASSYSTIIDIEADRIDLDEEHDLASDRELNGSTREQTTRNNQSLLGNILNFLWPQQQQQSNSPGHHQTQLGQFYTNRSRGSSNILRGSRHHHHRRSYRLDASASNQQQVQRHQVNNYNSSGNLPCHRRDSTTANSLNHLRETEICGNQQVAASASGSGVGQVNSIRGVATCSGYTSRSNSSGSTANVIVYRSIDMLRDNGYGGRGGQSHQNNGSRNQESQALKDSSAHDMEDSEDADAKTICSSVSSLSLNRPFCKICHLGSSKNGDKLISPCKCSGTMQYIHCGCLLKWLEISNRTNEKPMSCELCAHEYTWHKRFNYKQMQFPKCSYKDMFLHLIFVGAIGLMFFCALAPILCKKPQDIPIVTQPTSGNPSHLTASEQHQTSSRSSSSNGHGHHSSHQPTTFRHGTFGGYSNHLASSRLAHDEKFMILCAGFFFMSFFLAIYVQTKARDTLYGLIAKFLSMNQTYYITEYDHGQHSQQHSSSPVAVMDGNSNNLRVNSNSDSSSVSNGNSNNDNSENISGSGNSNAIADNNHNKTSLSRPQRQHNQQPLSSRRQVAHIHGHHHHNQELDSTTTRQQQQHGQLTSNHQDQSNRHMKVSSLKG